MFVIFKSELLRFSFKFCLTFCVYSILPERMPIRRMTISYVMFYLPSVAQVDFVFSLFVLFPFFVLLSFNVRSVSLINNLTYLMHENVW